MVTASALRNPFPPAALPGYRQPPPGYHCRWIWHPEATAGDPAVMVFRLPFDVPSDCTVPVHVSADQRYALYLDGQPVGRGPTRGDLGHWCYETYSLELPAGAHLLSACVWWLPADGAPMAQMYGDPGFLLLAEGPLTDSISTGAAPWQVAEVSAYEGRADTVSWYYVVGWSFTLDGHKYPWGWESDPAAQAEWHDALSVAVPVGDALHYNADYETRERRPQHHLTPAPIPNMIACQRKAGTVRFAGQLAPSPEGEPGSVANHPILADEHHAALASQWQSLLLDGLPFTVPAHQVQRVLIDLDNYYCAYPEIRTTGGDGASIRLGWAESLYQSANPRDEAKGNRDDVEGKYVRCTYDAFLLEGGPGRTYSTLWWRAGRYVDLIVETDDEPVTIDSLVWRETRYPLEMEATLKTSDAAFDAVRPLMFRTLQMCAHETYMDCPYYEQLQYAGDTRLEILATYVSTHDDRLPLRAATLFDQSRGYDGLTRSRYPSAVPQVIPPFSLWWVSMVYDLYMWRGHAERVRRMLPGVHAVLSAFGQRMGDRDLVVAPAGWNFVDWVPEWNAGWPPAGRYGYSAILNLQYVYAMDRAIYLFKHLAQDDLARHWSSVRRRVAEAIVRHYWVPRAGLMADDLEHSRFSEHAQCLALLCNLLQGADRNRLVEGLLQAPALARTTVYFTHYLFEALYHVGALAESDRRLAFWRSLPEMGLKTVLEQPEPSRSDCHAWGAHPLFHAYASFLGARPAEPGFSRIRIAPQPGPFRLMRGRFPDAKEDYVSFDLAFEQGIHGSIALPDSLEGELLWRGTALPLYPGTNAVNLD